MGRNTSVSRESAAALAALIPKERLEPAVRVWAEGAPRRRAWAVAFSGGADSLALLMLVWAHWPEHRRTLVALHFDHRMRGAESSADAEFCRRICAALGVRMKAGAWERRRPGASEAEARAARMRFLAGHARVIWLGHQQDDIAESMLMRLARGSGAGGLAAPRPVQRLAGGRVHLRPLLSLKKQELMAALRAVGLEWREDSSNAKDIFYRNRIRREVLPRWIRAAQRDALAGAALARRLLEEDDAALEAWVAELKPIGAKGRLSLRRLYGKPRAVWRRALHFWLARNCPQADLSRQAFEAILDSLEAGRETRHSLTHNRLAVMNKCYLRVAAAPAKPGAFCRCAN